MAQAAERITAEVKFFTAAVVLGIATTASLLFVFLLPEIRATLVAITRANSPAPIATECRQPLEVEQLHIVVASRDGRLITRCMYLGSTGTYYRR